MPAIKPLNRSTVKNYAYDNMNRLTSAAAADGHWSDTYTYDGWGNMKSKASVGGISIPNFGVNSQNQATAVYSYDAAGAGYVTQDGTASYGYDPEGRICAVSKTPVAGMTTMTGYIYDAERTRVAKGTIAKWSCDPTVSGFATTNDYILGPSGEQMTEMGIDTSNTGSNTLAWQHTNVWGAGKLLATYDINGLHFYLNDPLGTRRAQTDYAGVREQVCSSLPFGDGETCQGTPTEHLFTGKERDTESGNDYFSARYYASSMGRFMSPDPLLIEAHRLLDPQQLNLYAYGRDNPLRYTDPTGLDVNLNCSQVSSDTCKGVVGDYNNRKGAQFTVGRDDKTGLLTVDGKVDPSKLSSSEAALYNAIQDPDHHATLTVVSESDTVQFGRFDGNGHNTVDASDLKLLSSASSQAAGEVLGHETLEAYGSSFANGTNFDEWHAYANQFFGQATTTRQFTCGPPNCSPGYYQDLWYMGRINQTFTTGVKITGPMPAKGYQPGVMDSLNKVDSQ